ncbi:hypothetical protein GM661_18260 [Iocasia frigidifontis]|uniref:Uncharacterized protein n=1 Tax=Iocasia fonsfrigidae TaxID=2682810 RepID=A0A8A7KJI6_9FIRM|nr:hypothetical protein [Iocasia fonsfrigidae]QTL99759.1 hypothetical protein GM661_18260 [Iocasia fonsfrigidae]
METGDNGKVQSISTVLDDRRNDESALSNNLIERILNRNQAYKRVVRNKGSHGVDGMSVMISNYMSRVRKQQKELCKV